jgi:hypothetical protein
MSEHKTKDLQSFSELNALHERVFNVPTVRGFEVRQWTRYGPAALTYSLSFLPSELIIAPDPENHQPVLHSLPTTSFQALFTSESEDLNFTAAYAPTNLLAAQVKPFRFCSLYAKLQFHNRLRIVPTLGLTLTLKRLNAHVHCQTVDWKKLYLVDFSACMGTFNGAFAVQLLHRATNPLGCAVMYHRSFGGSMLAALLTHDLCPVMAFRLQRKIKNWRVGVCLYGDSKLRGEVEVGWMAKIGRYTIHSAAKSTGEIRSHFGAEMLPGFSVAFSGYLDHAEHAYQFGMSMEWETPKKQRLA